MSKNSAFGLAALLATRDPIGFALLSDISSSWPGSSGVLEEVTFLASGNFDPTAYPDALAFFVECWAGGGSGGVYNNGQYAYGFGSGGGGGEYAAALFLKEALGVSNIPVTIGSGGSAVTGPQNNGHDGGDTSFGSLVVANGGAGGYGGSANVFTLGGGGLRTNGISRYIQSTITSSSSTPTSALGTGSDPRGKPWSMRNGVGGIGGCSYSSNIDGPVGSPGAWLNTDPPAGGDSDFGGGGGGGTAQSYSGQPIRYSPGGVSTYSGNGGRGAVVNASAHPIAESGQFPSGGGGGGSNGYASSSSAYPTSGAGGSGQVKVSVIYA